MTAPLEQRWSPKRTWKAEIHPRDNGNFQVRVFRWMEEVVPDYGKVASFWSEATTGTSITDSIEAARRMADEFLQTHAGEEYLASTETVD